jgi:hypothetical protein
MSHQPPVIVVPAEALGIGQAPGGLPNLPTHILATFLTVGRAHLSGPGRAIFVVVFDGDVPIRCQLCTDAPVIGADRFSQDSHRIWHGYSVGRTVPVVMCRVSPTPFTGIMVVPLPWANVDRFCGRCGSADHAACQ